MCGFPVFAIDFKIGNYNGFGKIQGLGQTRAVSR